ncbi:MAG: hypothetical protein HXS52_02025 [Theionarchaea archaeon]|nr:hypothetical protein [Theionarchaea archaeon]MBU7036681.1 hypothetical protein [Theionarchaea archaeon]
MNEPFVGPFSAVNSERGKKRKKKEKNAAQPSTANNKIAFDSPYLNFLLANLFFCGG